VIRILFSLFLFLSFTHCTRSGPPAQQKFEREEAFAQHFEKGVYRCTKCGALLFRSENKLKDPSSRWPLFSAEEPGSLRAPATAMTAEDKAKLNCSRCHLHVGHYCRDGKLVTAEEAAEGAPICAQSAALRFEKTP
jgi:peptide methionine sulfoxide reductase MsrB